MKQFEMLLLTASGLSLAEHVTVNSVHTYLHSPFEKYSEDVSSIYYNNIRAITTKLTANYGQS
jgi:hypothetical protein